MAVIRCKHTSVSDCYGPNHADEHVVNEITVLSSHSPVQEGHHYPIELEGDDLQHLSPRFHAEDVLSASSFPEKGNAGGEAQPGAWLVWGGSEEKHCLMLTRKHISKEQKGHHNLCADQDVQG